MSQPVVDRGPGDFSFIYPTGIIGERAPRFTVEDEVFPIEALFNWDIGAACVAGLQGGFSFVRPVDYEAAVAEWYRRFPGKALPQTFAELAVLCGESGDHRWGLALTSEERGEQVRRTTETLRNRAAALRRRTAALQL